MNNRRNFIKTAFAVSGTALLSSCESGGKEEVDQYADKDPFSYESNSSFLTRPEKGFDYYKFNATDYDGQKRSKSGMDKHRPIVKVAANKKEFMITFDGAVHKHGQYWTWIEITDKLNNVYTVNFPEPAKYDEFYGDEGKKFSAYVQTAEALSGWIRVRACSKPFGTFIEYFNTES